MLRELICATVFGIGLAATAAASTMAPVVKTIQLDKSGGWQEFRFDITLYEGIWLDGAADPTLGPLDALNFDISITETSVLQVTDAFRWGDIFELFANGVSLGRTSTPAEIATNADYNMFGDFNAAVAQDPEETRWSHAEFILDPGDYILEGYVVAMPEERGRGALRLIDFQGSGAVGAPPSDAVTTVPLPGTLPFLASVCVVLLAVSRKRTVAFQE